MADINDLLSPREISILRLLAQGSSVKMASTRLHLTPRTIHFHCRNIRAKLGAQSMLAVMFIAGRDNLLREYSQGSGYEFESDNSWFNL